MTSALVALVLLASRAEAQVPNAWAPSANAATGGAGVARADGVAGDMAANPASMAVVEGASTQAGGALVVPLSAAQRVRDPSPQRAIRGRVTPDFTPALFAAWGGPVVAAGVGVHAPWVDQRSWPLRWPGRTDVVDLHRRAVVVSPVVSARVGNLSAGVALNVLASWTESRRVDLAGTAEVVNAQRGPGTGVGATVGVLWRPSRRWSVGASHRTRMGIIHAVERNASSSLSPADRLRTPALPRVDGTTWTAWPDVFTAGGTFSPWAATRVLAELSVLAWALPSTAFSGHGDAVVARGGVDQALWMVAPDLRVRAGAFVSAVPRPSTAATAADITQDQAGLSAGVGWRLFGLDLDVAWMGAVGVPRVFRAGTESLRLHGTVQGISASVGWRWQPPLGASRR